MRHKRSCAARTADTRTKKYFHTRNTQRNPCQNRNAMGASNALISAELSLAGVKSITPIDETIGVMYAVGRSIPSELRETSLGGMAVAKSACENCMACANKRNKMKK